MTPLFDVKLLNQPFGDPVLRVRLTGEKKTLLFDLGDITCLHAGTLLKVSHVFVSHTHIDHFIGFDHLIRLNLARDKTLHIYGPDGIIKNVKGKLGGYTWNLVDTYPFIITVSEIRTKKIHRVSFICRKRFQQEAVEEIPFQGIADQHPHYTVRALRIDHKIPSLAYSLEERFHININKDSLIKAGLPVGQWLREMKDFIWQGKPDSWPVRICKDNAQTTEDREITLGQLKKEITTITRGQKLVYVSDCRGTQRNIKKLIDFAAEADVLFCEGAFLEEDKEKAQDRGHLTAGQAGFIGRRAGVKQLQVFHFSPRYQHCPELLYREAERECKGKKT